MRAGILGVVTLILLVPLSAAAQYAETPRPLGTTNGSITAATQIGRRMFIGGHFERWSAFTGSAVVVTPAGLHVPGAFPRFAGVVHQIVPDGLGGYLVSGDFTSVDGLPFARFARVGPDGRLDTRVRVLADGAIRLMALAHGRVYLVGDFTRVDGIRRRGFAALDVATGRLSDWGRSFDPGGRRLVALSVSSMGVYVSGQRLGADGRVWGFEADDGRQWFERAALVHAIAATSARVYVGGPGYRRPVWAIDAVTGQDTAWAIGLQFLPQQSGLYGEVTTVTALMVDAGRLYFGGWFRSLDQRVNLAAVDAASGQALAWRAEGILQTVTGLFRVGGEIVATWFTFRDDWGSPRALAFNMVNGASHPWNPQPYGAINAAAPAPGGGVVIGGDFEGIDGVDRRGLAAVHLDTGELEPWTPDLPAQFSPLALETDGTVVIASDGFRLLKIDASSGAVLASSTLDRSAYAIRVAAGQVLLAYSLPGTGPVLSAISIADWSRRDLAVTFGDPLSSWVESIDVSGDVVYLAGWFTRINGVSRRGLAAVRISTGEVLSWDPSPDTHTKAVRVSGGRLWVGGEFRRIGGARRRGLAELDPVTGRALAWNPDVPVGVYRDEGPGAFTSMGVLDLEVGPDGLVYAALDGSSHIAVSGQRTPRMVVFSPVTGRRLPWYPSVSYMAAVLPDCLVFDRGCLPRALTPPADLRVEQAGAAVTLRWLEPADGPPRTDVRIEVGSAEGLSDFAQLDLPAGRTTFSAVVPPGQYFARVRSLAGPNMSLATPDVSFAVGPPDVPASPLDVTAVTEGGRLTVAWRPPSTGAPAAYRFEAGTAPGARDVASIPLASSAASFAVDVPTGRYFGRLVPINGAGAGAPSAEVLIDVNATVNQWCHAPPDPPLTLSTMVTGTVVHLVWAQPDTGEIANTQRLLVGSAPGAADIGEWPVDPAATTFTTTAPPGTYWVRVLGINQCGASPSSNEVHVVVP